MKYCRRRRGRDDWSPSLMNKVISWKILWWHVKYMCIALSPNWNREVRTNASGAHILFQFQTFIILPFLSARKALLCFLFFLLWFVKFHLFAPFSEFFSFHFFYERFPWVPLSSLEFPWVPFSSLEFPSIVQVQMSSLEYPRVF